LGVAAADGGIAYLATRGVDAAAEQVLADMEDLGARSGYLVDVLTEDDTVIRDKLTEASMIVIGADASVTNVRSAVLGAAIGGIQQAFENGAVVLAEGASATVFGAWILLDNGQITSGFEWLRQGLIVPGVSSVANAPETRLVMEAHPAVVAIGIGAASALALGPDDEVEIWGEGQVSIAPGPHLSA
jgi:hypothetical protein